MTAKMPPLTFERIKALACRDRKPGCDVKPVLCNRAKGHTGDHQHIRARDFTVLTAWPNQDPKPTNPRGATHGN